MAEAEPAIKPEYGETAARFEIGQRVYSAVFDIYMVVEAHAHAAGRWAYCLVDPIDQDGQVFTAGLSDQLRQDRLSEWHRDNEVWTCDPAQSEAEFLKEFWMVASSTKEG